ncbi:phosphatidate cytidylyltransferase [Candidatus Phytoplasma oryzae]|nr:phosphatidate cytidylyltransferase [Candidatus Phytoplasma oryzae]
MFLSNFIYFYICIYLEKKFKYPFFIYSFLFFVLLFINFTSKEILKLNKNKKNLFLEKNVILFSFIIFLYFFSILKNYIKNMIPSETNKEFFLYKIILFFYEKQYFLFLTFLYLFFFFLLFLFIDNFKINQFQNILFILLYISFFCSCFFTLINLNYKYFLYLFLITITNDSFAFFGGYFFGKNKLCPRISPKKTLEGFYCGIIFSLFFSILFFFNFLKNLNFIENLFFFIFSFLNAIIAQMGDLISSKIKRNFKIKDFNNIIPGHGGLLDRFDSMLFLSFFNILILVSPLNIFKKIIILILN